MSRPYHDLPLTALTAIVLALAQAAPAFADPTGAQVRAVYERYDTPDAPGCAVAVDHDGRKAFEAGYGLADMSFGVPITPDTAFDIGSTSKQFTAAAILLLAQDGKLSLDDDVRRYLPELPNYGRTITISHLLHHTSGLRDFVTLLMFADVDFADRVTPAQTMDILIRQKSLNFPVGDRYAYSNSGFFLLGQIVERVSGQSLRRFADQRLFEPLGMGRTHFADRHDELIPRRAVGYSPSEVDGEDWRIDQPDWEEVGDGGVISTVGDLLVWNRNFGAPIVGGPDFARQMEETGVLNNGDRTNYALGLMIDDHGGRRMVHHGGSWGGYRAEVARFPDQALVVATLCNSALADASDLAVRTADLWLPPGVPDVPPAGESARTPARTAGDPLVPGELAGVYRNAASGALRTVELKDGGLEIVVFGGRYDLAPTGPDAFRLVDGPFEAEFGFTVDPATGSRIMTQKAMQRTSRYEAIQLAHPGPDEVATYAGSYDCPELGKVYVFEAVDGVLTRRDPRGDIWRFDALDQDAFGYGNLTVRFQRDPAGAMEGAIFDIGRVRGLECRRL